MKTYFFLFVFTLLGRFADATVEDILEEQFSSGASMSFICPGADSHPCFKEGNPLGDSLEEKMGQALTLKWNAINSACGVRRLRGSQEQDERQLQCSYWCRYEPVMCDFFCGRRLDEGENNEARALQEKAASIKALKSFFDDFPSDISYTEEEEVCMEGITCTMEWVVPEC